MGSEAVRGEVRRNRKKKTWAEGQTHRNWKKK